MIPVVWFNQMLSPEADLRRIMGSTRPGKPLSSIDPGTHPGVEQPGRHVARSPEASDRQREGINPVKVFVFDLLPYAEPLDDLVNGSALPYPLGKSYFKPDVAVRTYAEHLEAWELMDRLGYDGVGFNEHHTSPYGLMNSPNLMAAAASQRTKKLKLLIYGNLLPLHQPLRLAEELAMIDCLSNGRLIAGVARGIPREYAVHSISMAQSRARFEEAFEIITRAWTEEVFSFEGKFHSYKDIALWPRPVQQPHPPIWTPITTSKESIEFAARHNIPITPGESGARGLQADIIRYYARCLARSGHRITPGHLSIAQFAYIADSKAQAVREAGPYYLYFNRCLFSHGNVTETALQRQTGYVSDASLDYVRPENLHEAARLRENFRNLTMPDVEKRAETMPWGTADEVAERLLEVVKRTGAGVVHLRMNTGALPHELFMNQIKLFAEKVLPRLQAYEPKEVPAAAEEAQPAAAE
jgi:alkanesulfonate monooxygenase SsuD/methylene tetrahydromethanopterin reductase-like flavin-dependent oxidoreductase (luciferase family)